MRRGLVAIVAVLAMAGCSMDSSAHARPSASHPKPGPPPSTVDDFFGTQLHPQDFGTFGFDRVSIKPSSDGRFPTALRARYPADSASQLSAATSDTAHGGAQL